MQSSRKQPIDNRSSHLETLPFGQLSRAVAQVDGNHATARTPSRAALERAQLGKPQATKFAALARMPTRASTDSLMSYHKAHNMRQTEGKPPRHLAAEKTHGGINKDKMLPWKKGNGRTITGSAIQSHRPDRATGRARSAPEKKRAAIKRPQHTQTQETVTYPHCEYSQSS